MDEENEESKEVVINAGRERKGERMRELFQLGNVSNSY